MPQKRGATNAKTERITALSLADGEIVHPSANLGPPLLVNATVLPSEAGRIAKYAEQMFESIMVSPNSLKVRDSSYHASNRNKMGPLDLKHKKSK